MVYFECGRLQRFNTAGMVYSNMVDRNPRIDQAALSGLAFLEELENKHQLVLTELEQLNDRIEAVLKEYIGGLAAPSPRL